jgi:hypothetical protein
VHGFNDLYPLVPISFANIAGFTRAAVNARVTGVAVAIWGMIFGGNAENYFYGLAYAAQVAWSSRSTDIAEFNRRFASFWFDVTKPAAANHVDRLFWFPWRSNGSSAWDAHDIEGYWQNLIESSNVVLRPFDELARNMIDEELEKRVSQSRQLLRHVAIARKSLRWLQKECRRNAETLLSMDLVIRAYEHLARKMIAVGGTALRYRGAHRENPFDHKRLLAILTAGIADLKNLKGDFLNLKAGYRRAVARRNGDPLDLPRLAQAKASLDKLIATLRLAVAEIENGRGATPPEQIAL